MSLLENTDKIHTTQMGVGRIKRNLKLNTNDVVGYCISKIKDKNAKISRKGKNYYVEADGCIITVNASSYTIITAHLK
jgi:hypothetical protein